MCEQEGPNQLVWFSLRKPHKRSDRLGTRIPLVLYIYGDYYKKEKIR